MPEIIEFYGDYEPPFDVGAVVRALLPVVPPKALSGLRSIVLTASTQLPSKERRRKIRALGMVFLGSESRGCYREQRQGRPATIELYVDNMVKHRSEEQLQSERERELLVGETLFHEIGHHVHRRHRPRNVDTEIVAEEWRKKLLEELRRIRQEGRS